MRIALIVDWHSEKMGYSDNFLPKALANLGHEVHLVTTTAQVYFNSPNYRDVFEAFLGPGLVQCEVKKIDGYTLHRLPIHFFRHRIRARGLFKTLRRIQPDIVQCGETTSWMTFEAALAKPLLGYKLFSECHIHASVFPITNSTAGQKSRIYWEIYRKTIGRFIAQLSERCYPISEDAAILTARYFGFPKDKITIRSLGVDTDLFQPPTTPERQASRHELRKSFGFTELDIVVIYTGSISPDKSPDCLAEAIRILRSRGFPYFGLFIGGGNSNYINRIQATPGCKIVPFVQVQDLPKYYHASDVAVWPKRESTSQLDAIACGLPIILSDRIQVTERVDGNGLLYQEGDPLDLAERLFELYPLERRTTMGHLGAQKMKQQYSWIDLAQKYGDDYRRALNGEQWIS